MRFGAVVAVDDVSFRVTPREVVGLIGPNGAGKTTIVDALTGFTKPSGGSSAPQRHARWGAILGSRPACARGRPAFVPVARALRGGLGRGEPARRSRGAHAVLRPARPGLAGATRSCRRPRSAAPASSGSKTTSTASRVSFPTVGDDSWGSHGAIASAPSVLLLDEPAAGLDDRETSELGDLVRRFADQYGMAVLLIEHDVELVLRVCDRIVVVDFGRKIAEGTPAEIRQRPRRHRRVPG